MDPQVVLICISLMTKDVEHLSVSQPCNKMILSEVMKTHKNACGMHAPHSVDTVNLGKEEGSRWRNTCVSWLYSNRVDSKGIKGWMGMKMMVEMIGDIWW